MAEAVASELGVPASGVPAWAVPAWAVPASAVPASGGTGVGGAGAGGAGVGGGIGVGVGGGIGGGAGAGAGGAGLRCENVSCWLAIVARADRSGPELGATARRTVSAPLPLSGLGVAHGASVLAVQEQAAFVRTSMVRVPPSAPTTSVFGETAYAHGAAAWDSSRDRSLTAMVLLPSDRVGVLRHPKREAAVALAGCRRDDGDPARLRRRRPRSTRAAHRQSPCRSRRWLRRPPWARTRSSGTAERCSDWSHSTHWNYRTPVRPAIQQRTELSPRSVFEEPCVRAIAQPSPMFRVVATTAIHACQRQRVRPPSQAYDFHADQMLAALFARRGRPASKSSTAAPRRWN